MEGLLSASRDAVPGCRLCWGGRASIPRARGVWAALAAVFLFGGIGCGGGTPADSKTDATESPSARASGGAPSDAQAAAGTGSDSRGAGSSSPADELAGGSKSGVTPQSGTAAASARSPSNRSGEDAPAKQPPAPQPTPEQLARWTRPTFEPLELLAYRDSDQVGLVTCMEKTPDGQFFVLGGMGVTVWQVGGSEPARTLLDPAQTDEDRLIRSLAVSPDGKWVAAGDAGGRLTIWNLADQSVIVAKDLYQNDIVDVAISPDSQQLATISFDNAVSVWTSNSLELKKKFDVPDNGVKLIEFMTPALLVVAGEKITSWNAAEGTQVEELSPGRYQYVLARSPDEQQFVYGVEGGLNVWNVGESKIAAEAKVDLASGSLLEFSPDGKHLAIADGSMIRIWDVASQQVVQVIDALGPPIRGLCWMPGANVLVVASETGRTRVWGSPAAGQAVGLAPVHAAVALPDKAAQEPATPAQVLAAIDLRSFPRLPGVVSLSDAHMLNYQTDVDTQEATDFYRYFLGEAGWTELPAAGTTPEGTMEFDKNGFQLTLRVASADPSDAAGARTTIDLTHLGNVDPRSVPRIDDASVQVLYESRATVLCKAKLDLVQIETALLRAMHEAGWTAYARLNASHGDQADMRDMEFLKNGVVVRFFVQRPADDPSAYHIQYSGFWTPHAVPIPRDSGFVEFDGSTAPYLVATTAMSLDETREFYDAQMAAMGWIPTERGRSIKEDGAWLAYLRGQQEVAIRVEPRPDGRTLVRVGEGLENTSWQLAEPEPAADASEPQVGIEAADVPILSASGAAKYDATSSRIEFQMDATPLAVVAEKYTAELAKFGFTPEESGIRDTDYTLLTFVRDDAEIDLRATNRDGNAEVSLMGDGLLWTKPLPGPKQIVSYEAWLRQNRHPAGLDLLEQYATEMRSLTQEN